MFINVRCPNPACGKLIQGLSSIPKTEYTATGHRHYSELTLYCDAPMCGLAWTLNARRQAREVISDYVITYWSGIEGCVDQDAAILCAASTRLGAARAPELPPDTPMFELPPSEPMLIAPICAN